MTVVLARVTNTGDRPFCAGLLFSDNTVVVAAPLLIKLGFMGKTGHEALALCEANRWTIERVPHKCTIGGMRTSRDPETDG